MALERSTFKWGGVTYPLPAATTNSLLQDADPAIFYALDYWAAMIQQYVGARWAAECINAGRADIAQSVVQSRWPYDPAPYLNQEQVAFPALAAYRIRSLVTDQSEQWERTDWVWGVDFVLPPNTAGQVERLNPILPAIVPLLAHVTTEGSDASYTPPGGTAGAVVWGPSFANVQSIGFTSARIIPWEAGKGLTFPMLRLECAVKERQGTPAASFDNLTGTDVDVQVQAADTTIVDAVASFKTNQ